MAARTGRQNTLWVKEVIELGCDVTLESAAKYRNSNINLRFLLNEMERIECDVHYT